jgi:hypothetical protein
MTMLGSGGIYIGLEEGRVREPLIRDLKEQRQALTKKMTPSSGP